MSDGPYKSEWRGGVEEGSDYIVGPNLDSWDMDDAADRLNEQHAEIARLLTKYEVAIATNVKLRRDTDRLRRQVEAVEARCNVEIASYKGASGNYDSYHEGRSDAGAVILDAMREAAG